MLFKYLSMSGDVPGLDKAHFYREVEQERAIIAEICKKGKLVGITGLNSLAVALGSYASFPREGLSEAACRYLDALMPLKPEVRSLIIDTVLAQIKVGAGEVKEG